MISREHWDAYSTEEKLNYVFHYNVTTERNMDRISAIVRPKSVQSVKSLKIYRHYISLPSARDGY